MKAQRVIVAHETWGSIYFSHLEGDWDVCYVTVAVAKAVARHILKPGKFPFSWRVMAKSFLRRLLVPWTSTRVIIALAPFDFRLLYFAPLRLRAKATLVYHTSWPYWLGTVPRKYPLIQSALRHYYRWFLRGGNVTTVAVTSQAAESVRAFSSDASITVIPHAVPLEIFQRYSVKSGHGVTVGFVGQLTREKGVDAFCDAAKAEAGRNIQFEVAGAGPLERLVRECERAGHLRFKQRLEYPVGVARFMGSLDVLVVPSRRTAGWEELFGRVIIEAWAASALVIATDHVGPCALIENGINGILIKEEDLVGLADVITNVTSDRARMKKITECGAKSAAKFSAERVSAAWRQVIRQSDGYKCASAYASGNAR